MVCAKASYPYKHTLVHVSVSECVCVPATTKPNNYASPFLRASYDGPFNIRWPNIITMAAAAAKKRRWLSQSHLQRVGMLLPAKSCPSSCQVVKKSIGGVCAPFEIECEVMTRDKKKKIDEKTGEILVQKISDLLNSSE